MQTYIYGLADPRDNTIRYVGKSDNPHKRLSSHLSEAKVGTKTHKCNWLRMLLKDGIRPVTIILETCHQISWQERERYWIAQYSNLTNEQEGGHTDYDKIAAAERMSKPVLQYSLAGDLIKEWASSKEAAEVLNLKRSNISKCCAGGIQHTGYYQWRFKDDPVPEPLQKVAKLRTVYQYDLSGNLLNMFADVHAAVAETGITRSSIINCCIGACRTTRGYVWSYENKQSTIN